MKQRLTIMILTAALCLFRCGGSVSEEGAEGVGGGTVAGDDGSFTGDAVGDVEPELVTGVKMLSVRNPHRGGGRFLADNAGCSSVPYDILHSGRGSFCFSNPEGIPHLMTLWDGEGRGVFSMQAGEGGCVIYKMPAGTYELEVCYGGEEEDGNDGDIVFIAPEDVSGTVEDAVVSEEEYGGEDDDIGADDDDDYDDYDDEYDDDWDEEEDFRGPRELNAGDFNIFLSTNTCTYCDLRDADFATYDNDLAGATLTGSDLRGAIFYDDVDSDNTVSAGDVVTGFTGANLTRAKFDEAVMDGAIFTNAVLTSASLKDTTLNNSVFTNATLTRARLDGADLDGANFTGATLTRARLDGITAIAAVFTNAGMNRAVVTNADLTNAVMNTVNLSYAKCGGTDFTGANLSSLTASNLSYAYFNGALMTNANLTNANLTRARFNSADLTNADLTGTTIPVLSTTRPVFKNTIFTDATWTGGETCLIAPGVSYYDPATGECQQ